MGTRAQTNQENPQGNRRNGGADHQNARKSKPGRQREPQESGPAVGLLPVAIIEHYFKDLRREIGKIDDMRDPAKSYYSVQHLIFSALSMLQMHIESRRRFEAEMNTPEFLSNLLRIGGTAEETQAHSDTVNAFLKNFRPGSWKRSYAI